MQLAEYSSQEVSGTSTCLGRNLLEGRELGSSLANLSADRDSHCHEKATTITTLNTKMFLNTKIIDYFGIYRKICNYREDNTFFKPKQNLHLLAHFSKKPNSQLMIYTGYLQEPEGQGQHCRWSSWVYKN